MSFWSLAASDIGAWAELWLRQRDQRRAPSLATCFRLLWTYVGLRATVLYRLSHALHRRGVSGVPQSLWRMNIMLHGLDIPPSVEIGPHLYIPHPVGTVVMASRIGRRATLVSGVTIGMRNELAFPVIGDDVFVGAGARVLGGITVGDDVSIGANAVVLADVPSHSVAVGVPARVKRKAAPADPTGQVSP